MEDLGARVLAGCPTAESLAGVFRQAEAGWPAAWSIELLAGPGQPLTDRIRPGDILMRRAPAEGRLVSVGVLESSELASTPEAGEHVERRPGYFARVRFADPRVGTLRVDQMRRIVDAEGRMPRDQALLRMRMPTEHQMTGGAVLRPGRVGPPVDGTVNRARIALVSPSGALDNANTVPQITQAINNLTGAFTNAFTNAGHQVAFDLAPNEPSLPHRDAGTRYAGTDTQRWDSLRWGLFDPATSAAIAIRGGHGATRLLDELETYVNASATGQWPHIDRRHSLAPKRAAGFSDFTAVLLALYSRLGWAGIHGPMPVATGGAASLRRLIRAFTVAPADLYQNREVATNLRLVDAAPARPVRGVLLGGNLSLVEALYGSPFFPSLQGALLFVEEINEALPRIDRMIEGLKHRGAAGQVRGVIVGRVSHEGQQGNDSHDVAQLFFNSWGVPCVSGLAAGHGGSNRPLWIGLEHELQFPAGGGATLVMV